MSDTPNVFISVGGAPSPNQANAAETIFDLLEIAGLSPRQMRKNEWSSEQPLRAIRKVMEQCHGIVVIAFTRFIYQDGVERQRDGSQVTLSDIRLPTVWNQIEAAMGYMKGVPLFLIAERGIRTEGLFEQYDWQIYWTDFDAVDLNSEKFRATLTSWKTLVIEHTERTQQSSKELSQDLSKMPLSQLMSLFGRLSAPQLWKLGSAILAFLMAVATVSYRIGAETWPWQ